MERQTTDFVSFDPNTELKIKDTCAECGARGEMHVVNATVHGVGSRSHSFQTDVPAVEIELWCPKCEENYFRTGALITTI